VLVRESHYPINVWEVEVMGMCIVDSAVGRTKLFDSWPELLGDSSCKDFVGLEKSWVFSDEEWDAFTKGRKGMKRRWLRRRRLCLRIRGRVAELGS
jgi:hypothetical protein